MFRIGLGSYCPLPRADSGLDLDAAVAATRHARDGAGFCREVFASHADGVIVARLTAYKPGRIHFTVTADSQLRHAVRTEGGVDLVLSGRAPSHVEPSYRRIENAVIYAERSRLGGRCVVRAGDTVVEFATTPGEVLVLDERLRRVEATG
ncbi:MAG: glycoside hydrolase N-terminal domain-containing protein [Burkholderiales bacterium]|nr:glycoside hydrolase N-terminal domain-containing protein [Opitutaceae bacterium]